MIDWDKYKENEKRFENMDIWAAERAIAEAYEYKKWMVEIPYITWPRNLEVKAIPNFSGSVIRYWVRLKGTTNTNVSIYLDCYDRIGLYGSPYWEIYPDIDGDSNRFDMNDTAGLVKAVQKSLNKQKRERNKNGKATANQV